MSTTVLNSKISKIWRRNSNILHKVNGFFRYTNIARNRIYKRLRTTFNYNSLDILLHHYSNCLHAAKHSAIKIGQSVTRFSFASTFTFTHSSIGGRKTETPIPFLLLFQSTYYYFLIFNNPSLEQNWAIHFLRKEKKAMTTTKLNNRNISIENRHGNLSMSSWVPSVC